ncbi:DNA-binding transcriptional LysR family regulator [Anaerosolibacter carboniphilus]|uniref:DNA-binding transcriptional LysR family regulator n=1 Tax=Anaerosolibacter carboniphilus TaxID=1417629 RepID=A0A841KL69_9FIRM|nr:LysR family transcriptional regulator [Anaerosolibacter carboniphilus]MBB6214153.1 DNA-binding transcriptional LysR family regulator [Anaerosolibacter carboniphilus]
MIPKELVYITTVAAYGNISKAAERLFIAQSSLSRCILKLESDLGIELFKRTSEGLKPTFAGEYYIKNANKIIQLYKELEIEFSNINDMNIGKLVVGTTTHLGSFVLPKLLATFTNRFPKIELSIVESVSTEIEDEILKGRIDVGILHSPINNPGIKFNVVHEEKFLLAVPPNDPINEHAYYKNDKQGPYIDIQLTANRPYILTHTSQRTRQVTTKILENANINVKTQYLTKSIQTASRLVRDNLGFTLVPHSYCELFGSTYSPNYYFIEEKYAPSWELIIAYSKDIPLSRASKEFYKISLEIIPQLYNFSND